MGLRLRGRTDRFSCVNVTDSKEHHQAQSLSIPLRYRHTLTLAAMTMILKGRKGLCQLPPPLNTSCLLGANSGSHAGTFRTAPDSPVQDGARSSALCGHSDSDR